MNRLLATVLGWILVFGMLLCSICSALAAWGDVDTTFTLGSGKNAGFNLDVTCVALQSDGKIVAGGGFTQFSGNPRNRIARLNSDGTLDTTFDPGTGANDTVWALAVQPDGKVVIAGQFTTVNGVPHSKVARLNANGSLDPSFNPAADGTVAAMALQADGKVLISGAFTTVSGELRNHVARLMSDGGVDSGFNPALIADNIRLGPFVASLGLQADGHVVIGGQFTDVGSASRNGIARLNPDGSLDLTFDPGPGTGPGTPDRGSFRDVNSIAMQPDGKILAAGDFTNIVNTTRYFIARLNTDGSLDTNFVSPLALANGGLITVNAEVDGKILSGGDIERFDGANPNDMARLNADGSYDTNFSVGTGPVMSNGTTPRVRAIAFQPDGKMVVGGGFTTFNGIKLNYIARLLGDQGGSIEFAAASYQAEESGGDATIAVHRTGSTIGSVSVNYVTSDGSAIAGLDYVAQTNALVFGPGETTKNITVPILRDSLTGEMDETVNLTLGNPIGGAILGNQKTATLTIINNTNSVQNSPPVLAAIPNQTIDEQARLTFRATATDSDGDSLTFGLDPGAPDGAGIDPASGVFSWTPTEAQGPGSYGITVRVTDNGSPPMGDTRSFTVVVQEVNSPPVLWPGSPVPDQTALPGVQLVVTNFAADSDSPANVLTFSLEPGAPGGAAIDPATGVFTWTPAANQSPGTYPVTVRVTDNGVPSWSDRGSFNIVVVGMPVIESIVAAGGNPTITWGAVGGRNYRVQFKSDLNILSWSDLPGDVTATGSTASKIDTTISGAERFYRIVLLP